MRGYRKFGLGPARIDGNLHNSNNFDLASQAYSAARIYEPIWSNNMRTEFGTLVSRAQKEYGKATWAALMASNAYLTMEDLLATELEAPV